jgi:hypothetical protein
MKSRPLSITLISWLFIATGSIGMVHHIWEWVSPNSPGRLGEFEAPRLAESGPSLRLGLVAILGGGFLLRGAGWARWLLVAWMALHMVISALHSLQQVLVHGALFGVILFFLFRQVPERSLTKTRLFSSERWI